MKVYAIVAASGTGSRFKSNLSDLPKQFLKLKNKPVILYSLLALQNCKEVDQILVSADKKYFGMVRDLAAKNKITKLAELTEGGRTRFDSVRNAFGKIRYSKNDLVLIHDAARPLIDRADVSKIISEAKKHGVVIYALKVSDTVKKSAPPKRDFENSTGNYVSKTVSRDNLWLTQTPQVFRCDILVNAYKKNKRKSYTDEAALVEAAGYDVRIIEGKRRNVKITTSEDFQLAKKLV